MIRVSIHCTTALHVIEVEIKNIQIALYICTYNIAFRCEFIGNLFNLTWFTETYFVCQEIEIFMKND